MTKPLGYYCSPSAFLSELEETYGSQLEKLSKVEKLHVLNALIINLINAEKPSGNAQTIQKLQTGIHERLPIEAHLSLADAIVNQLKYQSFQR